MPWIIPQAAQPGLAPKLGVERALTCEKRKRHPVVDKPIDSQLLDSVSQRFVFGPPEGALRLRLKPGRSTLKHEPTHPVWTLDCGCEGDTAAHRVPDPVCHWDPVSVEGLGEELHHCGKVDPCGVGRDQTASVAREVHCNHPSTFTQPIEDALSPNLRRPGKPMQEKDRGLL